MKNQDAVMLQVGDLVKVSGGRLKTNGLGDIEAYRTELDGSVGIIISEMVGGFWVEFDEETAGGFPVECLTLA